MALHYPSADPGEAKLSPRNYSQSVAAQKTPFSIEDILYQRNNAEVVKRCNKESSATVPQAKSDFPGGNEDKKIHSSDRYQTNKTLNLSSAAYSVNQGPHPPAAAATNGHQGTYASAMNNMYPTGPTYSDGYLHMIAPYLTATATGYKSVDPYFLSQGK